MNVFLIISLYFLLGTIVVFSLYFLDGTGYRTYYLHMCLPIILFFPLVLLYIAYDKLNLNRKIKTILKKTK